MSINSLTDLEMRRQWASAPQPAQGMAAAPAAAAQEGQAPPIPQSQIGNALDLLAKYIPIEVITLYVAAVSAVQVLPPENRQIAVILYWAAALLTPVFLVLVLMSKQAAAGQSPIPKPWPVWRMIAATIAFLVWALAVPGNPYITTDALHVLAGFGAIFISTIMSLLDPIFVRS